jgi:hypothetical protein
MANMTYCRFENTRRDLDDCHENMYAPTKQMSSQEKAARENMFDLITKMAKDIENMSCADRANGNSNMEFDADDGIWYKD